MHRAVILLGLLLAAVGALLGALGSSPVAAASIVVAGAIVVVAGLWLRRRAPRQRRADVPVAVSDVTPETAPRHEPPTQPPTPTPPTEERERPERAAIREAELARETELNAIAEGLRSLKGSQLEPGLIPEWKSRIETWVDVDLKARADWGEVVTQQAAEWMRDFGDIPNKDWRRHLLRHLRRLGYRNYQEGEW